MKASPFFLLGLAAQSVQIVLFREFLSVFAGTELTLALLLGYWLAWAALGGMGGALLAKRMRRPMMAYLLLAWAGMFLAPLSVGCIRHLRDLWPTPPGEPLPLVALFVAPALLLLPAGGWGWAFALASQFTGSPARVYLVEGLGALVGGSAVSLLLWPWVGPCTLLWWTTGLHGAAAWVLAARRLPRGRRQWGTLGWLMALALATPGWSRWEERQRLRFWEEYLPGFRLRAFVPSPYGDWTVLEREGQHHFYQGSLLHLSLPEPTETASVVHLALLQREAPRRVLILGRAAEGIKAALRHPVEEVEVVEPDGRWLSLLRRYGFEEMRSLLRNPRLRLHRGDHRAFLSREGPPYDLIVASFPEPTTLALNRFFTEEFFRRVEGRLAPEGVFLLGALALPPAGAPEALWRRLRIVEATLRRVFPKVSPVPSGPVWFLATRGRQGLLWDLERLKERARQRGLLYLDLYALTEPEALQRVREEVRTGQPFNPLAEAPSPPPLTRWNTDAQPEVFYLSLLQWAFLSGPHWAEAIEGLGKATQGAMWGSAGALMLGGLAMLMLPRARRRARRWALGIAVGVGGLWGMIAEMVLLMAFQNRFGTLHQSLGLLVALFMLGLALGTWGGEKIPPSHRGMGLRILLLAAAGGAFGLGAMAHLIGHASLWGGWALSGGGILMAGGVTGGLFALASHLTVAGGTAPGRAGGFLYGADLLGGLLGSWGLLFLLPLQGLGALQEGVAMLALAGGVWAWGVGRGIAETQANFSPSPWGR